MKFLGIVLDIHREATFCPSVDLDHFKQIYAAMRINEVTFLEKHHLQSKEENNPKSLLQWMYKASDGYDAIVVMESDSLFYNVAENKSLIQNFEQYDCDIGFGEDFPKGVIVHVIRREVLPVLENLRLQKHIPHSRTLFDDLIHIDVNMFDLENHYAPMNLKSLRLSFLDDNLQDHIVIQTIKSFLRTNKSNDYGIKTPFKEIAKQIHANRHLLRTIPKYYEIEVSNVCEQECIFCPKSTLPQQTNAFMSLKDYQTIFHKIYEANNSPIIAFTGMGDAGKNPEFIDILRHTLKHKVQCYWETSACELDTEKANLLLSLPHQEKLILIFSIDAISEVLYRRLRPSKHSFHKTLENIEYLLLRKPKTTYVQVVKMKENIEHLVEYHNYFKQYTSNIIIQKYNHYKKRLPERRINPMQPFHPIDCWHLKRDMVIDVHGEVRVCKQDLQNTHVLGNLKKDSFQDIHHRGQKYFEKHISGWSFCKDCDEYYTYNE